MPYSINGQLISDEAIRAQEANFERDPRWRAISDPAERAKRVRSAAELAAIDTVIIEQLASRDQRAIDPVALEREVENQRRRGNCTNAGDESKMRQWIEAQFRLQRIAHEMAAGVLPPTPDEIEAFYYAQQQNFRGSAMFRAAHVVKHTNAGQDEDEARAAIQAAFVELQSGTPFSEVAERFSDCKGNGGDLGEFAAGTMVQEFEDAIRNLKPGERTGIFRTLFGFHIAELRGKTPAGTVGLEEVRDDIKRVLTLIKRHQHCQRIVAELRSRADIRWIPGEANSGINHEFVDRVGNF